MFSKPHGKNPFRHLEIAAREITHKQQRLSTEGRTYPPLDNISKEDFRNRFHKCNPPPPQPSLLSPHTFMYSHDAVCGLLQVFLPSALPFWELSRIAHWRSEKWPCLPGHSPTELSEMPSCKSFGRKQRRGRSAGSCSRCAKGKS
jgi:hypothetical protein